MAFLAFERLFLELFRVSSILPSLCFWFGLSTWLYLRINFWVLNYGTGLRSAVHLEMCWVKSVWLIEGDKVSFRWRGQSTALSGKLKWQKNIQSISRLLRERPHPGLQNEPPLDSLDPQSPNPFMASPSPDPIQRLAIKGFRDWGSRLSSGGSFWSPGWGRSHSSLKIDWIFFCHFNFLESAVKYSHLRYSRRSVNCRLGVKNFVYY